MRKKNEQIEVPTKYWTPAATVFVLLQVVAIASLFLISLLNTLPIRIVSTFIIYVISSVIFIWWAKKRITNVYERQIFYFLLYYLFIIFTAKVLYALLFPEYFWPGAIGLTKATIDSAYYVFLVGYVPFFTGYLIWGKTIKLNIYSPNNVDSNETHNEKSYVFAANIIAVMSIAGLLVKAFSLYFLQIGVPSVLPQYFYLPYLSGIIYFASSAGLLLLLTVLIMLTAVRRWILYFCFSLILLLVYATMDLSVGWKSPLISCPLIIGMVAYVCRRSNAIIIYRSLLIGLVILSFISVNSYVGIQYYRFSKLAGKSDISRLSETIFSVSPTIMRDLAAIYRRLGGLEQIIRVVAYLDKHPKFELIGIKSIWGNEATEFYTHKVIGSSMKSKTSYSSSQWGQFLFSIGMWGLIGGMFMLGILMRIVQRIFIKKYQISILYDAIVPNIFIFFRRVLAGTGEFIYLAKYILILWIYYWLIGRLLEQRKSIN